jgi:dGTPase
VAHGKQRKTIERLKLYDQNDWVRESPIQADRQAEPWRTQPRRDYGRLIHCPSFRRLQGKTQLFPSHESDFFRNRLTHSIEVAQIAKAIAIRLNYSEEYFQSNPIDLDLVEFAALAHDIGHPPFGHNGEAALDRLMLDSGGFEGNAQTLRILSCIEKKETHEFPSKPSSSPTPVNSENGTDQRRGLNLAHRTLAAILKYDNAIPPTEVSRNSTQSNGQPVKGYYDSEKKLVDRMRTSICGNNSSEKFKTIECSIMDIADDIAYSTYDMEDSFKAGFLSPISMISQSDSFKSNIASRVLKRIKNGHPDPSSLEFTVNDVNSILADIFHDALMLPENKYKELEGSLPIEKATFVLASHASATSDVMRKNGYIRSHFTSKLVGLFIDAVELIFNDRNPKLSTVQIKLDTLKIVETLKAYSVQQLIESPMLKLAERQGQEILGKIFDELNKNGNLLPEDWRDIYNSVDNRNWRARVVCDYIAGMTDRYCVEMYSRITGVHPMTIWKPH